MTVEDLMSHNVDCFTNPRKEFDMRRYLARRFVEHGTEKLLAKTIEFKLGGNGELPKR